MSQKMYRMNRIKAFPRQCHVTAIQEISCVFYQLFGIPTSITAKWTSSAQLCLLTGQNHRSLWMFICVISYNTFCLLSLLGLMTWPFPEERMVVKLIASYPSNVLEALQVVGSHLVFSTSGYYCQLDFIHPGDVFIPLMPPLSWLSDNI